MGDINALWNKVRNNYSLHALSTLDLNSTLFPFKSAINIAIRHLQYYRKMAKELDRNHTISEIQT